MSLCRTFRARMFQATLLSIMIDRKCSVFDIWFSKLRQAQKTLPTRSGVSVACTGKNAGQSVYQSIRRSEVRKRWPLHT